MMIRRKCVECTIFTVSVCGIRSIRVCMVQVVYIYIYT